MRTLFRSILVFCGCVVVSGGVWRLLLSADDPSMPIGVEAKARSWRDGSLTPAPLDEGRARKVERGRTSRTRELPEPDGRAESVSIRFEILDADTRAAVEAELLDEEGASSGKVRWGMRSLVVPFQGHLLAKGYQPREIHVGSRQKVVRASMVPSATARARIVGPWRRSEEVRCIAEGDGRQIHFLPIDAHGYISIGPVARGPVALKFLGKQGYFEHESLVFQLRRGHQDIGDVKLHRYRELLLRLGGDPRAFGKRVWVTRHYPEDPRHVAMTRGVAWYAQALEVENGACRHEKMHPGQAKLTVWTPEGGYAESETFFVPEGAEVLPVTVVLRSPGGIRVRARLPRATELDDCSVVLADNSYGPYAEKALRRAYDRRSARVIRRRLTESGECQVENAWPIDYAVVLLGPGGEVLARSELRVRPDSVARLLLGPELAPGRLEVEAAAGEVPFRYALIGHGRGMTGRHLLQPGTSRTHAYLAPGEYDLVQITPAVSGRGPLLPRRTIQVASGATVRCRLPLTRQR